jgi:hypothetical protein
MSWLKMDGGLLAHPPMYGNGIHTTSPYIHQIQSRPKGTIGNWNAELRPRKNQQRPRSKKCGKSCPTKKASSLFEDLLAIKSLWLTSSNIWRAQTDAKHGKRVAETRNIQKKMLDLDIATLLRSLHRKRIRFHSSQKTCR